ncbi:lanthionine synthetase LanC family protein [Desertibacillus haloalkaliphilus]|uniref:lanthionine synthetase LanC family protein n=1 Tax=Desertibacillus haloalkaliphilus TaxID=1328930 RepID=UPI001C2585C5|nr:lanthionine synthetase LanC family protein [Desertibacillus haloalkaliphilus]MBU8906302.1 protein kinase/lanthionine synthetase C family protein [Desertibacillus haloalkaliphilus]
MENQFVKILNEYHLNPEINYPWANVGTTNRVQGWKLHLSTIESEAVSLLRVVVPYLREKQISFKITQDEDVLGLLNEGALGSTQVGKFMTIYPNNDHEAKEIAEKLIQLTPSFHGPIIRTDLRLSDIVYARYGCFNPIISQNRLGLPSLFIQAADGSLRADSYEVPFVPPSDVPNPFKTFPPFDKEADNTIVNDNPFENKKMFGPGYIILDVIRAHAKGSVLLALDLRSQEDVGLKVIKQGRQYCFSDKYDRDIRTRLKYQETLHKKLSEVVPIPKVDSYFEVKGHGYLPMEYIEGQNLEHFISYCLDNCTWNSLRVTTQIEMLEHLIKIIDAVKKLHGAGYVHRDLTGTNIWIGSNKQVYLIDLELAHAIDDESPPFNLGTLGFMSPEQNNREQPTIQDDIYSLGCVMLLFFTGFDPLRIQNINKDQLSLRLGHLLHTIPSELIETIVECIDEDPNKRPLLTKVEDTVQRYMNDFKNDKTTPRNLPPISSNDYTHDLHSLIHKAQKGLLHDVITDPNTQLWMSAPHDETNEQSHDIELLFDTNKGVAGVIYLLSRLSRFGYGTKDVQERVVNAVRWLVSNEITPDQLPGLHFGHAGYAVAVAEAIAGGMIQRNDQIDEYMVKALRGKLDWPDITHGAAGQGIAALYCSDRLNDEVFSAYAHECVAYLIKNQKEDGSWEMPEGVDGMSGETLTGFAHGVAGIVYFLAEYDRRYQHANAKKAWQVGAGWLMKKAIPSDNGKSLLWEYSDKSSALWKWWCHGSPGIALTFLRLYEQTKEQQYAEVAEKALKVHSSDILTSNLSQCHGLSGLGDIYLEGYRVLEDSQWLERAQHLADKIINLRRENESNSVTWITENPYHTTADLMVGSGSVVHFLLNLSLGGEKTGFPLLLEPIKNKDN